MAKAGQTAPPPRAGRENPLFTLACSFGRMHRALPILLLLLLAGCDNWAVPTAAAVGVEMGSIVVFGRGVGDLGVSALSGRDCSIVHLDQGHPWCRPTEQPSRPMSFCTQSLGDPDCWAGGNVLPDHRQGLGDAPKLTTAQRANRRQSWLARWLGL